MRELLADVVVAGGGTAGVVAAIAAARLGADTLVVEQMGALGGTQANGWVTPMMPNYLGDFKLDRGLNLEIVAAQSRAQPPPGPLEHGDVWYDPVGLACVLDDLAAEAGVRVLLNSTLVRAERAGRKVWAVEIATRGGDFRVGAKAFVDATGDADLCVRAGAETSGGNEDGLHQPMTLRFAMGNVDLERARTGNADIWRVDEGGFLEAGYGEATEGPLGPKIREAVSKGVLIEGDLGYFQVFTVNGRPREMAFNCPRIAGLDPLDPFEMSEAYRVGRAKIRRIAAFVQRWLPGFEEAYVSAVAPLMGIRESRRVVGEYILTAEDHLVCRKFPDVVARNRYPIDIHLKKGIDYRKFPPGEWHEIPYRSLVAKGFDNLWVAGRCLSADFVAQSAVRIQPVCRSMGQAAGSAAALCARSGLAARDLPYPELAAYLDLSLP